MPESEIQSQPPQETDEPSVSFQFLAATFLKVGLTAWGGFMALVAIVQGILVERRRLLTAEEMMDGISLGQLLPGPMAVNVVSFAGYRLRGGLGALVSATMVLLPSFFLVIGLTWVWQQYGEIPQIKSAMAGFPPAIAAIIISAVITMGRKTLKGSPEKIIAVLCAGLLLTVGGFYLTISVIAGAAVLGLAIWYRGSRPRQQTPDSSEPYDRQRPAMLKWIAVSLLLMLFLIVFLFFQKHPLIVANPLLHLFTLFSGMSLMLFGGGFVFIPMIQGIVVQDLAWVTADEFTTALAIGQITPGPILVSATVIGFLQQGFPGGFVATVGIFLPPSLLMIMASQALESIKGSPAVQSALRGVRAAITGLILAAAVTVIQTAEPHWATALIFAASLTALLRYQLDVIWIIPSAGLLGLALL